MTELIKTLQDIKPLYYKGDYNMGFIDAIDTAIKLIKEVDRETDSSQREV